MGKTYDLELHRPKEDKVPYICKLTFNAPGDDFGDIVQVRGTVQVSSYPYGILTYIIWVFEFKYDTAVCRWSASD